MKNVIGQVTQQGNVDTSGSKSMTIDAGAIGKLMGMFSNQYSNKDLAVLREYFCNGDDARIAAGGTRPTEVSLPTDLQPSLIVRDYGIGLDKDGLVTTFATYGLSTKGDTNDQTGAFGIGSKAAFTMGQQFTVTGYKDGVMTTALFALDSEGIGQVTIMHEGPTQEPNGVLVSLAVPDVESMRHTAEVFFSTVPKGRALVDGEEPAHLFDTVETSVLNDVSRLVKDGNGEIKVAMGPVVYPINRDILRKVAKRLENTDVSTTALSLLHWDSEDSLYFEVPMGALTIAPSREDLRDTDATLDTLASLVTAVAHTLIAGIQDKLDKAVSYFDAAMILHRETSTLKAFKVKKDAFKFGKNTGFKTDVDVPLPVFSLVRKTWRSENKIVGREDKFTVDFNRATKVIVVAGVPKDETSKVSRYSKRFLEQAPGGYEYILVSEQNSGQHEWFEYGVKGGVVTVTLDEYRKTLRQLRDSNPRTRTEPSYTTGFIRASRDLDDRDLLTDIISWGKDIVVFRESAQVDEVSRAALADYTPVVLLGTQSEAMLRKRVAEDGTVNVLDGDYRQIVREYARKQFESITDDERAALGAVEWLVEHRHSNGYTALLESLGDDVEIKHPVFQEVQDAYELAELVAQDISTERKSLLRGLTRWVAGEVEIPAFEYVIPDMNELFPLLRHVGRYEIRRTEGVKADVVAYINSKA